MTDWRDIPMAEINWRALRSHIGRSAQALRRFSHTYRENQPPKPYGSGAWSEMTLGQVADMGRRELLRHNGMGETSLAALQYVIDLAAAGKLPLTSGPADDALRPTDATAEGEK